jgi:hypothetical protein
MTNGFSKTIIVHVTCHKLLKIEIEKIRIHSMFGLAMAAFRFECIENVWREIKIRLAREQNWIKTRQELVEAVMKIWNLFTPGYIQCLYKTLLDRSYILKAKNHANKRPRGHIAHLSYIG